LLHPTIFVAPPAVASSVLLHSQCRSWQAVVAMLTPVAGLVDLSAEFLIVDTARLGSALRQGRYGL
jgi:hypothetical protein